MFKYDIDSIRRKRWTNCTRSHSEALRYLTANSQTSFSFLVSICTVKYILLCVDTMHNACLGPMLLGLFKNMLSGACRIRYWCCNIFGESGQHSSDQCDLNITGLFYNLNVLVMTCNGYHTSYFLLLWLYNFFKYRQL